MTSLPFVARLRRRFPQTVRIRLTLLYGALFFGAGALLLALTYGLVASSLPTSIPLSKLTSTQQARLNLACKQSEEAARSKGASQPQPVSRACVKLTTEAANAATTNQRDEVLHNLLLFSLLGLGVMTLISGGLGWLMAGRALRPVAVITGAARRASDRHLGERLNFQGPRDELKELADTFDSMLERLDVAFASQRRFVADASHELRTPLTVMRTAIDVTLAKPDRSPEQLEAMATKVRRSVDRAEKMVDALLTLAVSDREPARTEFIDLATVTEDAVDIAGAECSRLGLQVETHLDPAETYGDLSLVERLVGNLVENAVRHNVPGGWIDVRTGVNKGCAQIEVSNSGRMLTAELLQTLFEPFRRVAERTNSNAGVGLGLAIVRSISAAHGGTLDAKARADGGLTVSVAFPCPKTPLQQETVSV
jgi:signal transduction histidine kinase